MKHNVEKYHDYLLSEEWKQIRHLVAKKHAYLCYYCYKKCRDKKFLSGFQVHHTTYDNIFNEKEHLEDLQFLCEDCHQNIAHKNKGDNKIVTKSFPDCIIRSIKQAKSFNAQFKKLTTFLSNSDICHILQSHFNNILEEISKLPKKEIVKEYKDKPDKLKYPLTQNGKLKFNCKYCHSNKYIIKRLTKNIGIYCGNPKCKKYASFLNKNEVAYYKSIGAM